MISSGLTISAQFSRTPRVSAVLPRPVPSLTCFASSAIALCLLFPRLHLWQGVLITAFDVIILLALRDPLRSTPVKMFEILIAGLVSSSQQRRLTIVKVLEQVLAVLICMLMIISKMDVDWPKTFEGFLPSKYIFGHGGLYICNFSSFLC
jgi:metal iron transporter